MKILITILLSLLPLFGAKLTKSGDYVIDDINKLMWQDSKINTQILFNQEDSVKYCDKLSVDGFSDWRLPTKDDYKKIIDKSRKREELMINRSFKHVRRDHYWTYDRTWRNFGLWGYYIYFKSGTFYYENRTYPKYVRCVRDMK